MRNRIRWSVKKQEPVVNLLQIVRRRYDFSVVLNVQRTVIKIVELLASTLQELRQDPRGYSGSKVAEN